MFPVIDARFVLGVQTGVWETTPGKSSSIRQPHWHRHLVAYRPSRAVEELHQVAATRTERRQIVKVDYFLVAGKPGMNSLEHAYAFLAPNPVRSRRAVLVDHHFGEYTSAFFSTASLLECIMSRLMGRTGGTGT